MVTQWARPSAAMSITLFSRYIAAATPGVGLLSQFPPSRYFPNFLVLSKHTSSIEDHVYIWQVSPQLSCGGTCQIYTWFKESKRYFCQIENSACGEISKRSFSNPHPRPLFQHKDRPAIGISIIKLRRSSSDRLIFIMENPIPVRRRLYIEIEPLKN